MEAGTAGTATQNTKSPSMDAHIADRSSKELTPAPSRDTSAPAYSNKDLELDGAVRLKHALQDTPHHVDIRNSEEFETSPPRMAHVKMEHDSSAMTAPSVQIAKETNMAVRQHCPDDSDANAIDTSETSRIHKEEDIGVNHDEAHGFDDTESLVLSPPPDTPDSSDVSAFGGPEEEIVVVSAKGKAANAKTQVPAVASGEESKMQSMDPDHASPTVGSEHSRDAEQRPKRKRDTGDDFEEKADTPMAEDSMEDPATPVSGNAQFKGADSNPSLPSTKGVLLGYWRESDAPDPDKHVVKGFIDSRDRLRTRIQPVNHDGKTITNRYPLKPGPGGSWVTFHNIIFDEHLVHLDQHQVKEYVKLRADFPPSESAEDAEAKDKVAVQKAIDICQKRGPLPEGALPPLIAYGAVIPEHARISYSRAEKRRRIVNAAASASAPSLPLPKHHQPVQPARIAPVQPLQPVQSAPVAQQVPDDLPGHRPTKILLGYWKESAEPKLADKHAVFGILGNNDMFRVKVGRETRDGRPMNSNFPQGAGALWINTHQWEREEYLVDLTREEIKEYCRVRQWQIDHGERDAEIPDHRRLAIVEARRRNAAGINKAKPNGVTAAHQNQFKSGGTPNDGPAHETRQAIARRSGPAIYPATSAARTASAPQTPAFRAANRSSNGVENRLERASNLALNAVSRIEANQAKVEERDAHLGQAGGQASNTFRESIGRLNNVWSAQEAHRIRTGNEDAKIHMGVKYERKRTGPFAGKLVSQGAIISIDGEDYVEYRVLTKPTFI